MTKDVLETYISDFLFEPAIEFGKVENTSEYQYISKKKTALPQYLKNFVPSDHSIEVEEGPEMMKCIGIKWDNQFSLFFEIGRKLQLL